LTFGMFVGKIWGGGDSKLAMAAILWVGALGFMTFILTMALTGLLLAFASLGFRVLKSQKLPGGPESWPARLAAGENAVPYGIAIAAGTIHAIFYLGYADVFSMIQEVAESF